MGRRIPSGSSWCWEGSREEYLLSNRLGGGKSTENYIKVIVVQIDLSSEFIDLQTKSHFLSNSKINL